MTQCDVIVSINVRSSRDFACSNENEYFAQTKATRETDKHVQKYKILDSLRLFCGDWILRYLTMVCCSEIFTISTLHGLLLVHSQATLNNYDIWLYKW